MDDIISRRGAIDQLHQSYNLLDAERRLEDMPPAQPTLYGYSIEHLVLIARVLQKENFPPERITEMLTDIGRFVAIVIDEYEESLRKAVEQCVT